MLLHGICDWILNPGHVITCSMCGACRLVFTTWRLCGRKQGLVRACAHEGQGKGEGHEVQGRWEACSVGGGQQQAHFWMCAVCCLCSFTHASSTVCLCSNGDGRVDMVCLGPNPDQKWVYQG